MIGRISGVVTESKSGISQKTGNPYSFFSVCHLDIDASNFSDNLPDKGSLVEIVFTVDFRKRSGSFVPVLVLDSLTNGKK